jgi:hypothetical protein
MPVITLFDRDPELPRDDQDAAAERKRLDLTFLLVKESNISRWEHLLEVALESVGRALALWSNDGEPASRSDAPKYISKQVRKKVYSATLCRAHALASFSVCWIGRSLLSTLGDIRQ